VRDPLREPMPNVRGNQKGHANKKWRFWITKL